MVIGVDLGGTNIHAGVVTEDGTIKEFVTRTYEKGSSDLVIQTLIECIRSLSAPYPGIKKAGVVSAGQVDRKRRLLLYPVNIKGLDEVPIIDILKNATGLEVACENDAVGAALAEGWIGMAAESSTFISITMGTGIGTGVVIDNRVFRGGLDLGCEWGHVAMSLDGLYRCGCGNTECIETHCSATALVYLARTKGMVVDSALEICKRGEAGDPIALEAFDELSRYLSVALYNYTIILNPEIIVIGGGLSASSALFLPKAVARLKDRLGRRAYMMPPHGIVCSEFPGNAGVLGAAYLCLEGGRIKV